MNSLILIKYGELSLKKGNRKYFEKKLIKNIRKKFNKLGIKTNVIRHRGRFYLEYNHREHEMAVSGLKETFGIVGFAPVLRVPKNMQAIREASKKLALAKLASGKPLRGKTSTAAERKLPFKVEPKRTDKSFPLNSYGIACDLGDYLLSEFSNLKVDVHKPELIVNVEIREMAYLYADQIKGPGGLPVGASGRGILLLSGGIDSPVAGYYMAKRGLSEEAVYFDSPPYTSEKARDKVVEISRILARYIPDLTLHIFPFTKIQERIKERSLPEAVTLMMRGAMVQSAHRIAEQTGALCLITGESLGQVASQTPESIHFSGSKTALPVFRPLIGMDKEEIIRTARAINTYETSILPYEDCCTLFAPLHPVVKPSFDKMETIYKSLQLNNLIEDSIERISTLKF